MLDITPRIMIFLIGLLLTTNVMADQPSPRFIQFSSSAKGALHLPDPEVFADPHVAVFIMHKSSNYMNHLAAREFSKRGLVALGMNPRCENNETLCVAWENNMLDARLGVEYLRNMPGITKIVLFGHSGGGPTMAFYQAIAVHGVELCQKPERLVKCSDELAGMLPADGIILWDAHLSNGINAVRSLNPAVINDADIILKNAPPELDPSLDPFNPANGYIPNGNTRYSETFKQKYFEAQSLRMNTLIDIALDLQKRMEAGTYHYVDDAPFIISQGDFPRLMNIDLSIHHSTEKPGKLLKNDGTIEDCCVVDSVRPVASPPDNPNSFDISRFMTVRSFLSNRAVRSTNSMDNVDECSVNNSTLCYARHIDIPAIVVAMTGHYFVRNSEVIYENLASQDKEYLAIEGATHSGTPCSRCMPNGQAYDGRYDNAVNNDFDYLTKWILERF